MKKRLLTYLSFALVLLILSVPFFASNTSINNKKETDKLVHKNMYIEGEYKKYTPFYVNGYEIRLYVEPLMSAEEATVVYADAYNYFSKMAEERGISTSLDDTEFQTVFKTTASMNEMGSSEFIKECKNFGRFLDVYENIEKNKRIIEILYYSSLTDIIYAELESLMPTQVRPTAYESQGSMTDSISSPEQRNISQSAETSVYDTNAVVRYVRSWWFRTNNTDYPYYATFNNVDASSNDYNDLDPGRSGQSYPRRDWSDCTNFISQCLVAGGVPQINSILPYTFTSEWYYSNERPSNTW